MRNSDQEQPFVSSGQAEAFPLLTAGLDLGTDRLWPGGDTQFPTGGGLTEPISTLEGFVPGTASLGILAVENDVRPPLSEL